MAGPKNGGEVEGGDGDTDKHMGGSRDGLVSGKGKLSNPEVETASTLPMSRGEGSG